MFRFCLVFVEYIPKSFLQKNEENLLIGPIGLFVYFVAVLIIKS